LPRQERFAQLLAAGGDAVRAYEITHRRNGAASRHGMRSNAHRLAHSPRVAARVRELQAATAQDAAVAIKARAAHLQLLVSADPREIVRIVTERCPDCWPAESHDTNPNLACSKCRGEGLQRVRITDSDKLSAAGRALLKSIRQKANGEIEVRLHDPLVAADILNRMQNAYVTHNVTLNLSAEIKPLKRGMTVEEAVALMESIAPTTDSSVVSDQ
jgi:hypothetical protein